MGFWLRLIFFGAFLFCMSYVLPIVSQLEGHYGPFLRIATWLVSAAILVPIAISVVREGIARFKH